MKRRTKYTIVGTVVAVALFAVVWYAFLGDTAVGKWVKALLIKPDSLMLRLKSSPSWSEEPYPSRLPTAAPLQTPTTGGSIWS